ncbi:DUF4855 domain-containing protein [Heliorestis acidaminivorans]|uniref:DUF4855 domain-containing protein n=1 Tax=Heliorestis acidaminivorans TaxID=553427 RepID=UPI00147961DD|nr:DUF4855 domain-containing protein [Heliorestis acidaminivorans]
MKWFNSWLYLILFSLFMLFPSSSLGKTLDFPDLQGHPAQSAVRALAEQGIVSGTDNGLFEPDRAVNRAEFAVIIGRTIGLQPLFPEKEPFLDLPAHSFAYGHVAALTAKGLIQGQGEGLYGASQSLTRQDVAVMVDRILVLEKRFEQVPALPAWEDRDAIAPYALEALARVAALGLMKADQDGLYSNHFRPQSAATRGEVAIVGNSIWEDRIAWAMKPFQVAPAELYAIAGLEQSIKIINIEPSPYPPAYGINQAYMGQFKDSTFQPTEATGPAYITINQGLQARLVPLIEKEDLLPADEEFEEVRPLYPPGSMKTLSPMSARTEITGFADPSYIELEKKSYPGPDEGLLSYSPKWTGFYRQQSRAVTVDLGAIQKVSRFSMQFLGDSDQAITLPQEWTVEISQDGRYWNYVGKVLKGPEESGQQGPQVKTYSLTTIPVDAQYLRFSFPVDVWTFGRWLRVEGPVQAEEDSSSASSALVTLVPRGALSVNALVGDQKPLPLPTVDEKEPLEKTSSPIADLLLIYTGPHQQSEWRSQDFLPMIAYRDLHGDFVDTFFDGMLFLPYISLPSYEASWHSYLDNLFAEDRQLKALNDAVAQWQAIVGANQGTYPVVIALPYPERVQGQWKSLDERRDAIYWYKELLQEKWSESQLDNLELIGLYWEGEAIYDSEDASLVQEMAQQLEEENLLFYWIPYYEAPGLKNWRSYGFDQVFLQPNYYFDLNTTTRRLDNARQIADNLGIGLEIEGDERFMNYADFQDRYLDQLALPRDSSISYAYYFGSKNLLRAMYSGNSDVHRIYHQTYQWIKESRD